LCNLEILSLRVRADNRAAMRLYQKAGFSQQALLSPDTKVGADYFDGILMPRALTAPTRDPAC